MQLVSRVDEAELRGVIDDAAALQPPFAASAELLAQCREKLTEVEKHHAARRKAGALKQLAAFKETEALQLDTEALAAGLTSAVEAGVGEDALAPLREHLSAAEAAQAARLESRHLDLLRTLKSPRALDTSAVKAALAAAEGVRQMPKESLSLARERLEAQDALDVAAHQLSVVADSSDGGSGASVAELRAARGAALRAGVAMADAETAGGMALRAAEAAGAQRTRAATRLTWCTARALGGSAAASGAAAVMEESGVEAEGEAPPPQMTFGRSVSFIESDCPTRQVPRRWLD